MPQFLLHISNHSLHFQIDAGLCTTFNGPSKKPALVSKLIGSLSGLFFIVFLDQNDYIYGENLGAGL